MPHSPLICRECFAEAQLDMVDGQPQSDGTAQTGFVCDNCGNDSFRI
jgi:hypothetical protein